MAERYCGQVPVKVIAPLIERWVAEYSAERGDVQSYFTHGTEGNLEILSFRCGISARQLRRIIANKVLGGSRRAGWRFVDHITFDAADKIISAIDPWLWHTEPELAEHYGPLEVTYGELKAGYELPEGYDWDGLPQAKKYIWQNARQKAAA